jgi:hypothetical protein
MKVYPLIFQRSLTLLRLSKPVAALNGAWNLRLRVRSRFKTSIGIPGSCSVKLLLLYLVLRSQSNIWLSTMLRGGSLVLSTRRYSHAPSTTTTVVKTKIDQTASFNRIDPGWNALECQTYPLAKFGAQGEHNMHSLMTLESSANIP